MWNMKAAEFAEYMVKYYARDDIRKTCDTLVILP